MTSHKQTTDGNEYATAYKYNLAGALVEETYPSGRVVRNTLDANGDLTAVLGRKTNHPQFWAYANNFKYSAAGAVTGTQLGNGLWESTQFNSRLQPTQIALGTTQNASNLLDLGYTYGTTANNGNVLSQTIAVPTVGTTPGFTAVQNYSYDHLNRLQQADEKPQGWTDSNCTSDPTKCWKQKFVYDRYGNRRFEEANTTMPASFANQAATNPTISPDTNKLTSTGWSYDASGNTKTDPSGQSFTYDAENKQTLVTNTAGTLGQYYYDGDGKRVKKVAPSTGETTVFVYDAAGKLAAEYSTIIETTNAKVAYLTNDHLGSPRINTAADGSVTARHDYHPFGEEIGPSQRVIGLGYAGDTVRKQFTSYERDIESSLDFAEARYYNFNHGRFTTSDPLLASGRIEDPQTWNRYAYVLNNPLNYIDPTGLYECKGNKTQCGQFETRLNEARENLKKIEEKYGKDSKQYEKASASINGYGAKDEKNGVFVAFDRKKSGANTTGSFADNGKGKLLSITVHFNPKALDSDSSQSLVGHEGNHVDYFQTVGNIKSRYDFEFRGHEVQSLLAEAQYPDSSYYLTSAGDKKKKIEPKNYDIWNSSWEGPDRETLRTNAIKEWLAVPTSQGGYGLKPPPPPGPKPTVKQRRRG